MAVSKLQNTISQTPPSGSSGRMVTQLDVGGSGPSFQQTLLRETPKSTNPLLPANAQASDGLKFSQHAVDRMKSRGIRMSQDLATKLEDAVARAAKKGSKDALVVSSDSAFVVSVKNNTVITVMDREMMKENVFTNIDSTILI